MALSADDKREIKEEIREGLKEFFSEQGMTIAHHTDDHRFVFGLRKSMGTIRKASWWTLTTTGIIALIGLIWGAITNKF